MCVWCVCGVWCWWCATGFFHDSPRIPNVNISGSGVSQTPPKFNERTPKREKERKLRAEGKKQRAKFWAVLGRAVLGVAETVTGQYRFRPNWLEQVRPVCRLMQDLFCVCVLKLVCLCAVCVLCVCCVCGVCVVCVVCVWAFAT